MARTKSIGIRETLTSLLSRSELEEMARASGMMRRRRKVDPASLLWTLVFGFAAGGERSLAAMRRSYQKATGTALVPSAFYDRFTPELVRYLRVVLETAMARVEQAAPRYADILSKFTDVLVADATVVKLHRLLARRYPGTRINSSPAAAKLHLVMSVTGTGAHSVKLSDGRASDHRVLRMGPWVRDRLLTFDLGYFRYQLFDCIDRNGGYFLSRLATNANPLIVRAHRRWRGQALPLEGGRLRALAEHLRRSVLDVEVEVAFERRAYRGRRTTKRRTFRLVGVRHPASGQYHFYVTNIEPEVLSAEEVAQLYAARWQVELVFKELKTHYRLDELPTRKAPVAEALLLAACITWLVSRRLLEAVRQRLRRANRRVPEARWAALFSAVALTMLDLVLLPVRTAKALARRLEPMLLHEAVDPNRSRIPLLERVDRGCAWGA